MDVIEKFVIKNEYAISVVGLILILLAIVGGILVYSTIRRYRSFLREGFATQKESLESIYTEEQCPMIKGVVDMYNEMLKSKDTKKEYDLTATQINVTLTLFQDLYTNLSCKDYLERLERGEIQPKTSSPDNRPEGYTPQVIT